MDPPRTTHQEKKVRVVRYGTKFIPQFYEPEGLKMARNQLLAALMPHRPKEPLKGSITLYTQWRFKARTKKQDGTPKTTKPDTDNMIKLLKDCMTQCGFWEDDAQIWCETTEKIWSNDPGILIMVKGE